MFVCFCENVCFRNVCFRYGNKLFYKTFVLGWNNKLPDCQAETFVFHGHGKLLFRTNLFRLKKLTFRNVSLKAMKLTFRAALHLGLAMLWQLLHVEVPNVTLRCSLFLQSLSIVSDARKCRVHAAACYVGPSPNRRRPLQYSSFSPAVVLALLRLPFLRLPFLLLFLRLLLLLLLFSSSSSSF